MNEAVTGYQLFHCFNVKCIGKRLHNPRFGSWVSVSLSIFTAVKFQRCACADPPKIIQLVGGSSHFVDHAKDESSLNQQFPCQVPVKKHSHLPSRRIDIVLKCKAFI